MSVNFRMHVHDGTAVLAAADSELVGREFTCEKSGAKVTLSAAFYGDAAAGAKELRKAFADCGVSNLVGKEAISCLGLDLGSAIILIDGKGRKVPHLQTVVMAAGP